MLKILQINYRLGTPVSAFLNESGPVANVLSTVPGLRWKIWLKNENDNEGGGLYLFEDGEAVRNFVDGPVVAKLRSHPAIADVSVKEFDIPAELSSITRAPIH